jgi:hypothetical protein
VRGGSDRIRRPDCLYRDLEVTRLECESDRVAMYCKQGGM